MSHQPSGTRPVIANVGRLQEYMRRNECAAVVVRSGVNFTYLAGISYPGTLGRHLELTDSPRGVLLVWPLEGEPVIIVNNFAEPLTRRDSWVKRIEVYEAYAEPPYTRLASVIRSLGLDRARIGIEETYVSVAHGAELRRPLPDVTWFDCTRMMDEVRWVKTPGEIALLKRAADLQDEAYLEVFPTIRDGQTEREIHSRLVASCIRRGAQWAHGILNSSANVMPYGGESDFPFRWGDVVRTDYVSYVDGYPGHQSRNAVLGPPTPDQRKAYGIHRDVYRMMMDRCRPGARVGNLYDFVRARYQDFGWTFTGTIIGHSVGPWWHQQEPIFRRGSPEVLEEGMVVAIEPYVAHWHIQDMILVTKDSPQLLSDQFPTDEIFVIE
jgi:Xaa-Pro aminopeptidase